MLRSTAMQSWPSPLLANPTMPMHLQNAHSNSARNADDANAHDERSIHMHGHLRTSLTPLTSHRVRCIAIIAPILIT